MAEEELTLGLKEQRSPARQISERAAIARSSNQLRTCLPAVACDRLPRRRKKERAKLVRAFLVERSQRKCRSINFLKPHQKGKRENVSSLGRAFRNPRQVGNRQPLLGGSWGGSCFVFSIFEKTGGDLCGTVHLTFNSPTELSTGWGSSLFFSLFFEKI